MYRLWGLKQRGSEFVGIRGASIQMSMHDGQLSTSMSVGFTDFFLRQSILTNTKNTIVIYQYVFHLRFENIFEQHFA